MSDFTIHGPTLETLLDKLDRDDSLLTEDAASYLRAQRTEIERLRVEVKEAAHLHNQTVENMSTENEQLAKENTELRADIARLITGLYTKTAENERLRKRGDILHEALVDIISHRCNGWNHACEIARKAMDDAMHAYAMGKE